VAKSNGGVDMMAEVLSPVVAEKMAKVKVTGSRSGRRL
jgi:hypothetical protein